VRIGSALAQIPPRNLDITSFGQLPPPQLALYDHLETRALKVEGLHA